MSLSTGRVMSGCWVGGCVLGRMWGTATGKASRCPSEACAPQCGGQLASSARWVAESAQCAWCTTQPPCMMTMVSACSAMVIACNTLTTVVPASAKELRHAQPVGLVRWVQIGQGFVHQQNLRLNRQCTRQQHPPALAARELRQGPKAPVPGLRGTQRTLHSRHVPRAGAAQPRSRGCRRPSNATSSTVRSSGAASFWPSQASWRARRCAGNCATLRLSKWTEPDGTSPCQRPKQRDSARAIGPNNGWSIAPLQLRAAGCAESACRPGLPAARGPANQGAARPASWCAPQARGAAAVHQPQQATTTEHRGEQPNGLPTARPRCEPAGRRPSANCPPWHWTRATARRAATHQCPHHVRRGQAHKGNQPGLRHGGGGQAQHHHQQGPAALQRQRPGCARSALPRPSRPAPGSPTRPSRGTRPIPATSARKRPSLRSWCCPAETSARPARSGRKQHHQPSHRTQHHANNHTGQQQPDGVLHATRKQQGEQHGAQRAHKSRTGQPKQPGPATGHWCHAQRHRGDCHTQRGTRGAAQQVRVSQRVAKKPPCHRPAQPQQGASRPGTYERGTRMSQTMWALAASLHTKANWATPVLPTPMPTTASTTARAKSPAPSHRTRWCESEGEREGFDVSVGTVTTWPPRTTPAHRMARSTGTVGQTVWHRWRSGENCAAVLGGAWKLGGCTTRAAAVLALAMAGRGDSPPPPAALRCARHTTPSNPGIGIAPARARTRQCDHYGEQCDPGVEPVRKSTALPERVDRLRCAQRRAAAHP